MNRARVAARLVVLVALAGVVPVLGVGSVAVEAMRRRSEASARLTLELVARQAAARIGGYLAAQREALRAVATAAGGSDDAERRLEDVAIDAPSLGRLVLLGAGVPADGPAALDARALDEARSGREVSSEIYLDEGNAPVLDLCVPVRSRPGRAVCAQLDLFELWRFVQRIRVGESGYALAFDGSGRLIASGAGALRAAILTGEAVPERDAARLASTDPGAAPTRYRGPLGEEVLAGWASLPERGWTVVVEQPAAEALRAARLAQLVLAAVSLLALGLSVAVGFRQSRKVLADLEVEERWRTAGRIAAGITHDLGHRVAILQQTAGMAETGEPAYMPRIAENLRAEVGTLRKFVADFADLSRDVRSVERLPLDMNAFAESVRRSAEPHAGKHGVHLLVQPSTGGAWALADRYLLERAALNLLSNAIEAAPRGGEVRIEVEARTTEVALAVVDRGAGIPADRLRSIFDAFASTKRTGAHVGLGLPNVKRIVEAHGGRVAAESRLGVGSTFRILLSRTEPPA